MSVRRGFLSARVPADVATREAPLAEHGMLEFDIRTQARAEQFLAQVLHESGGLRWFEELASGAEYEGRRDLGNVQPGDGRRYKGRGPIQLTGRANYRWAGGKLKLDLEGHPELAADHEIGWRIAGLYWGEHGLNAFADRHDFLRITEIINGGQNGLESRRRYLGILQQVDCRPAAETAGRHPQPHAAPPHPAPAPAGPGAMRISPAGVILIKEFEGFPNGGRPYQDIVGVWTIGYGHIEGVGPNSPRLTQQQASDLLARDLDHKYAPAVNALRLPLTQHQFDALVSFVFNVGPGAISTDTHVGRALRAHDWAGAADALLAWNKAGGATVAGLVRRRNAERALFVAAEKPLDLFTPAERGWIREYDRLSQQRTEPRRVAELRRAMADQRKKIWRAAQPRAQGGDGNGWERNHRRERYASLLARSG